MPADALANALKDFGAVKFSAPEPSPLPASFAVEAPTLAPFDEPFEPAPDVDALIAEAVSDAEAALTERLRDEHAGQLQAERDRHAEEIALLQAEHAEETAGKVLAAIEDAEQRIVELTSAVTARILGVVLTEDMRQRSIDRLAATIREALLDDDAIRIRIRGSLPLYEALKTKLPARAEQIQFTESAGFDLSVAIDDSVFETRLAEWSSALSEILS